MRQSLPDVSLSGRIEDVLRRFRRNRDGTTMVEFGLIAIPFFALLLAIIQTAMIYYVGEVLQTAVADSSRLIMTGQATSTNYDKAKFKTEICGRVPTLFDCQNLVQVDGPVRRANQVRLRELRAAHGDRVEVFSAHDHAELTRHREAAQA